MSMKIGSPRQAAEIYEKRSEKTYLSRLELYRDLRRERMCFRILVAVLDSLAIFLLVAPVVSAWPFALKSDPELYATVAVAISVAQLCLSQIGNFINLDVRIELAKKAYVEIQHLSQNFELIKDKPGLTMDEVKHLVSDYQVLISTTENHLSKHYRKTAK